MTFSRAEQIEMVNMCMIYNPETNEVVVQDKINVKWKFGHSFPGGHVEPNEPLEAAMIREVYEETGLKVSNLTLCGTVEWFNEEPAYRRIGFLYKTSTYEGTLRQSNEGQTYWMNLDELNEANTADSFMKFLKIFNEQTVTDAISPQMYGSLSLDIPTIFDK